MNYKELMDTSRPIIGPYCKSCTVCNGRACKNAIPGPGAKGAGDTAIRNYDKWQDIRINMDTISDVRSADTSIEIFGRKFVSPVFAGPVGAIAMHYSDAYNDLTYNDVLVAACAEAGIAAFTGDGLNVDVMKFATDAIAKNGGTGVPTVKPWNMDTVREKMELVNASGAFAVAMDIDAAGLPFLKNMQPPAGSKSINELRAISQMADVPFIVKGIMTVSGALKALEAGASGIVVSNHGGRVLDQCAATAEVLPEICDALVDENIEILVDGGIRSGADVFKALAIGADAVIIARPFVNSLFGGGAEGVRFYAEKIRAELEDVMMMCGAASLKDINRAMIRL